MEVIQTAIEGLVIIEPKIFKDARGYFSRVFAARVRREGTQDKLRPGQREYVRLRCYARVAFSAPPFTQSKLVRCVKGRVLDVAVDIRKESPTYGRHVAVELSEENHRQFSCPAASHTVLRY